MRLLSGSCLELLPTLHDKSIDAIVTSPPYCNRYDYTRTYALELAFLHIDEQEIKKLRQAMLSCTVENQTKSYLGPLFGESLFAKVSSAFRSQALLQLIISYLDRQKANGVHNNNGIPRIDLTGSFCTT